MAEKGGALAVTSAEATTGAVSGGTGRMAPGDYFEAAWAAWELGVGEPWQARHAIGDGAVAIEGRGTALAQALLPALAHRRDETGAGVAETLRVRAGDGAGLPALPVEPGDLLDHDRVTSLSDERFVVVWEQHFKAVTLVDRRDGRAVYWVEDAAALPYYETAAPLRALWHAWFAPRGKLPLHGACVGRDGDALLLAAPGGHGKSTTALLALEAGFDHLADDWCLVAPRAPAVHSLFRTAKLRPDNLHRFPGWVDRIHNRDQLDAQKATFFLGTAPGGRLAARARLRAIVVPRVAGGSETRFAPATAAVAWHALMEVSRRGVAGSGREFFSLLGETARCAPVFRLELGCDLAQIPPALEAILAASR